MRLQTIHHKYPSGATLSKFDYTYDAAGNVLTWRQQIDTAAVVWMYGYDAADQLRQAVEWSTATPPTIVKRYAYGYDPAGNRIAEQIDDAVTMATHNSLNQLVAQGAGGAMTFAGTVNEPATVTIQGRPAVVDSTNAFRGTAPTVSGTNTTTITATDPSGNQTTQQYQITQSGSSKTLTYDANGSLTSDGTRNFEWDARNHLTAVEVGTHRSEFTYDGQRRRSRVVEEENGVLQSEARLLWCNDVICEVRDDEGVVQSQVTDLGVSSEAPRFYARDQLGTVHDVTDSAGDRVAAYEKCITELIAENSMAPTSARRSSRRE